MLFRKKQHDTQAEPTAARSYQSLLANTYRYFADDEPFRAEFAGTIDGISEATLTIRQLIDHAMRYTDQIPNMKYRSRQDKAVVEEEIALLEQSE